MILADNLIESPKTAGTIDGLQFRNLVVFADHLPRFPNAGIRFTDCKSRILDFVFLKVAILGLGGG